MLVARLLCTLVATLAVSTALAIEIKPPNPLVTKADIREARIAKVTANRDQYQVIPTAIAPPVPREAMSHLNAAKFEKILAKLDPEEAEVIRQTNAIRYAHGLRPLWPKIDLCMASRDHSHDMRIFGFFDHVSPIAGKSTHMQRARNFGGNAASENILYGAGGAASAVDMWMNSPGHRANILTPGWTTIGVGRSGTHYTQMFN